MVHKFLRLLWRIARVAYGLLLLLMLFAVLDDLWFYQAHSIAFYHDACGDEPPLGAIGEWMRHSMTRYTIVSYAEAAWAFTGLLLVTQKGPFKRPKLLVAHFCVVCLWFYLIRTL